MIRIVRWITASLAALLVTAVLIAGARDQQEHAIPAGRTEVVFWHFWGGEDRQVVDDVVKRFNAQQQEYQVRAVAMPGSNLDLKLFLAVTGGDPPDLINQDDPIMADWAARGALRPLEEVASVEEVKQLRQWLFPSAVKLGEYDSHMYAVCNGLDVRALYYNKTWLAERGLAAPTTLAELDHIAEAIAPPGDVTSREQFGYLPDPRRLWAWGIVFGGDFYNEQSHAVTVDDPPIVDALTWMASYRRRYGADAVAAFRQGDQSLPGKTFPLLVRRYAVVMDGQWRVRDINSWQQSRSGAGKPFDEFGVAPLPPPHGGKADAGWVNGNFFLLPRGAANSAGAWEFMKFWIGFRGHQANAAQTCIAGGWIPVSPSVVKEPAFQAYLAKEPLFAEFVRLAGSPHQIPTPITVGAPQIYREVVNAAETAMYATTPLTELELLQQAQRRIEVQRERLGTLVPEVTSPPSARGTP